MVSKDWKGMPSRSMWCVLPLRLVRRSGFEDLDLDFHLNFFGFLSEIFGFLLSGAASPVGQKNWDWRRKSGMEQQLKERNRFSQLFLFSSLDYCEHLDS